MSSIQNCLRLIYQEWVGVRATAKEQNVESDNLAITIAVYMLGFESYNEFVKLM